jgi:4-diphosphocytidyl-2-C-methyl-D-erythritol kinase
MSLSRITSFILLLANFKNTHNFTLCMLCFPNCKINLGLYVTGKRDDGYHNIETVFYPVGKGYAPLHDVLEIVPAADTTIRLSGLSVAGGEQDNLVWKALQLLKADHSGQIGSHTTYLHKVIPMGAGLGGGSADGAFMLRLLNDHYALGLDEAQLAAYALQLGSDCPFFIRNTPQFASGRGEVMTPVSIDLSAYSIQVICPQVHVSTARAFSMLSPAPASFDLRQLPSLPPTQWKGHISNNFEQPVFAIHPELAAIKEQLYAQGAIYASMSGSGSAVYGIFEKARRASIGQIQGCKDFYIE